MKKSSSIYQHILITDLLLIAFGVLVTYLFLEWSDVLATLLGIGLTSMYAFAGAWHVNTYFYAPHDVFMSKIYGMVALRLGLLAASIFVVMMFTSLPEITFIVSVFISYITKSIQEILFIHRKSAKT
jgi:hypothetical protein